MPPYVIFRVFRWQSWGQAQETTGTAVLLFHRFLIQERVGKHRRSRDVILTTCLFLAGKVTEAPRRLRDVINVLHMLTRAQEEPPLLDKVSLASCCITAFTDS